MKTTNNPIFNDFLPLIPKGKSLKINTPFRVGVNVDFQI